MPQNTPKTPLSSASQSQIHVFSGQLVDRDKTEKFLKGHQKIGGRKKGSVNFDTRLIRTIWNTKGVENHMYPEDIARALVNIALYGKPAPSTRVIQYILNMTEGPIGRMKRGWENRI
jgi:hypothetical protein